ncbi:MAG: Maf family protein [Bacillota bacterium]
MKLILASASPRRADLLRQVGIPFQVVVSTIKETAANLPPDRLVIELALAKAGEVSRRFPGSLVLGADTVVVHGGAVLGKPRDTADARRMLQRLSGGPHSVLTGLALLDAATGRCETACSETRVWMRVLQSELIDAYVATGEPMDKAGAYGIQEKAAFFVEQIEGCYSNVVGLPLNQLYLLLTRMEIKPWCFWRDSGAGREVDD